MANTVYPDQTASEEGAWSGSTLFAQTYLSEYFGLLQKAQKETFAGSANPDQMKQIVMSDQVSHLMTKPTKWHVHPAKTQISLGICLVWLESLLSIWRRLGSLATHWAHIEDADQTGRMPRLIWVFAGRSVILLRFDMRPCRVFVCIKYRNLCKKKK